MNYGVPQEQRLQADDIDPIELRYTGDMRDPLALVLTVAERLVSRRSPGATRG
jgi:hypothetical protein